MPEALISAGGYVLAALTSGLGIYYWRRSNGLYTLLVEGAHRFEEAREQVGHLEQLARRAEEKAKLQRDHAAHLESNVADFRARIHAMSEQIASKDETARFVVEKLELQKGHLEKMLAKAEQQQTELSEANQKLTSDLRVAEQNLKAQEQEMLLKEKDWRRELESTRKSARAPIPTKSHESSIADVQEIKRLKRKLSQYDRLYASMKGMREMTEERNRNWEVALRKMSQWIIAQNDSSSRSAAHSLPKEIGPLVGQAMAKIGAQLVDDHELSGTNDDLLRSLSGATQGIDEAEIFLDDDDLLTPTRGEGSTTDREST